VTLPNRIELNALDGTGSKGRAIAYVRALREEQRTIRYQLNQTLGGVLSIMDRDLKPVIEGAETNLSFWGHAGPLQGIRFNDINYMLGCLATVEQSLRLMKQVLGKDFPPVPSGDEDQEA
jgi:hypothetical protein